MKKILFIHSLFRSGSTYFFNKLRQSEKFMCFYEPLHQDIIRLNKQNIDTFWNFSPKKHGIMMKHPRLNTAHFTEYKELFEDDESTLLYFHKAYSFDEYAEVRSRDFKKYIDRFVDLGKRHDAIPTLQFNRTTLRIDWFQKAYPDALNIALLRNPRDQFESYLNLDAKVFEVMNLLIIKSAPQFSDLTGKLNIPYYSDDTYKKEFLYYSEVNDRLSTVQKYKIFFSIWLASLEHAVAYADELILMDRLQEDGAYRKKVQEIFRDKLALTLDFDDFAIRTNASLSLETADFELIESRIISQTSTPAKAEQLYRNIIISRYENEKSMIISDLRKCQKDLSGLNDALRRLTSVKVLLHPLKKYQSYKAMIDIYFRLNT